MVKNQNEVLFNHFFVHLSKKKKVDISAHTIDQSSQTNQPDEISSCTSNQTSEPSSLSSSKIPSTSSSTPSPPPPPAERGTVRVFQNSNRTEIEKFKTETERNLRTREPN